MVDLRGLLEQRSVNAPVAWLFTAVLALGGAGLLVAGKLLWAGFAVVAVAVVLLPPLKTGDPRTTMPGELVALVSVPVVLQGAGLFLEITPFVAMAGFSLLVVLAMDAFTSLEMAPRFAAVFVTITTMAFAGVWVMAEFALDALFGSELIVGQRELNLKLLVATVVGLLAGVAFVAYFRETDGAGPLRAGGPDSTFGAGSGESSRTGGRPDPADGPADPTDGEDPSVVDAADAEDDIGASPKHRVVVRALQATLVAIVVYAVATLNGTVFVNSVVPLALTLIPAAVRRRYGYPMHADLAVLVTVAATLHAVGALGPYATTDWWDTVTHALSSTLVAGVGYAVAHGLELHTDRVDFSPRFRGAFLVVFVLAVGVLWELLEFASGIGSAYLGGSVLAQYGVSDIVKDLAFNAVGAILVALFGTRLFRRPARAFAGQVGGLVRRD